MWRTYRIYENCWRAAGSYRVRSLCLVYIVVCTTTSCVLLRNLLGNRKKWNLNLSEETFYHFCPFLGPFLWIKMPFISKDWRSPGEDWVKYDGGWEKKSIVTIQSYDSCIKENTEHLDLIQQPKVCRRLLTMPFFIIIRGNQ